MTPYQLYLKSDDWKQKRIAVIARQKSHCARCGRQRHPNSLEVHHEVYDKDLRLVPLKRLKAYCRATCHMKIHEQQAAQPAVLPTIAVHCRGDKINTSQYIYCGRGSIFGNPFVVGVHGNRQQCIQLYKEWFPKQPDLVAKLPLLKGKMLGCWCKPDACHCDYLADLAEGRISLQTGEPVVR